MTAPAAPVNVMPQVPDGGAHGHGRAPQRSPTPRTDLGPVRWRSSMTAETWLALGVLIVVALLIVPLSAPALDPLLALSLGISITILLITLFTGDPLDFSIFPSLLLLVTLLRLGLNVNSTRLILGQGDAGRVIAAFGDAVIGGNYVVGLVIFLILVVINFMVITKGAGRIAEVAARFTLDAMPGRQMSIDADLSAGLIDEDEARGRRVEIARYADFYGAMDGAAKFVRGDAVAGLLITGINLVGGFVIGMTQRGLGAGQALATYTTLTVGDGLVTQIPALIVSTSAGIIVTYGSSTPSVGPAMAAQFTRHPRAIWMASGILAVLAVMPGFPAFPFLLLSTASGGVAWLAVVRQRRRREEAAAASAKPQPTREGMPPVRELLHVDPLELEVGYALVPLVDESQKGDLLQRVGLMRKQLALELGMVVPPVRVRDNIRLTATEYVIKLRGVRVARGEIMPQYCLALATGDTSGHIEGLRTTDPSYGIPAVWINPERRQDAEASGYSVVDPETVLCTHLMETLKRRAGELLNRQDTQELLDALKESCPALVNDLVPGKVSLGVVHRVLQRLLNEGVPIRDLATILEAVGDGSEQTKDPDLLTEHVRRALSSVVAQQFDEEDGIIRGITIGPRLEAALMTLFTQQTGRDDGGANSPSQISESLTDLSKLISQHSSGGRRYPLITPPSLRLHIRRLIEPVLPGVPVISLGELPPQTPIQSLATWELPRVSHDV